MVCAAEQLAGEQGMPGGSGTHGAVEGRSGRWAQWAVEGGRSVMSAEVTPEQDVRPSPTATDLLRLVPIATDGGSLVKRRSALAGATVGVFVAGVLRFRHWQSTWGAGDDELTSTLSGDVLLTAPNLTATRAITIAAPADQVWPWIAQLGQARGGFYTYDAAENFVARCDIHSADRIVPEWQDIKPGDEVKLHPEVALIVAEVDPGHALVLRGGVEMGGVAPPYDFTWAFVVRSQPDGTTRLVVRERYAYTKSWAAFLVEPVQFVSFVMSQKMLRGIRDRAEAG